MSWKWARRAALAMALVAVIAAARPALAQEAPSGPIDNSLIPDLTDIVKPAQTPESISGSLQILVLLTVLTLAPSILVLMTSFTRIIIVLSLLRQAMATQQLPPNQVLIGLALLMTLMIMGPVWQDVNSQALQPYLDGKLSQSEALAKAAVPVREFMIRQIETAGNQPDVRMFLDYSGHETAERWEDVPTSVLVPAFVTSELKTAFLMGFKIYLPFLIIDMVVASVLISMGMLMLPPVLISLPFKLLLFVLVDGWHLVIGSLLKSFTPI
ncbi:MAG: flagellar type III secretion system pore protein FliP [Anaerolineaceae bacterium]|nr:flagellar type III secretion system pore protein FliP [Anaerolineaceae bacterium]